MGWEGFNGLWVELGRSQFVLMWYTGGQAGHSSMAQDLSKYHQEDQHKSGKHDEIPEFSYAFALEH